MKRIETTQKKIFISNEELINVVIQPFIRETDTITDWVPDNIEGESGISFILKDKYNEAN